MLNGLYFIIYLSHIVKMYRCRIEESGCPLVKNTVCVFFPHRNPNQLIPKNDDLEGLYADLSKNCDVHQIFGQLLHITENHSPDIYKIIHTIKFVLDKIGIIPNIWLSYEKFIQRKNKLFPRKNYCDPATEQENEQKQLIITVYCLLSRINTWLETGADFTTGSEKKFRSEYQPIANYLKYGCVAKMWNHLKIDDLLCTFIRNAPIVLASKFICSCSNNITSDQIQFIHQNYIFYAELEPVLVEHISRISAKHYFDYAYQFNNTIYHITYTSTRESNVVELRSLYSYDELLIKRILNIFISEKRNCVYVNNANQIKYDIPRSLIYPGQVVPSIYQVDFPFRCILCDDKLTKNIVRLKSNCFIEIDMVKNPDTVQLCPHCTNFLVKSISDISAHNTESILNFRHHKMILKVINDNNSVFGFLPRDIIGIIIGIMYSNFY